MNPCQKQASIPQPWPGVHFTQASSGVYTRVSPAVEDLTGIPPERWISEPDLLWTLLHPSDLEPLKDAISKSASTGTQVITSFRLRHALTGRYCQITEYREPLQDQTGPGTAFQGLWLETTRSYMLEQRLAASQWKEQLGPVTLGFAHDFNNLLTGVLSLSEAYLAQIDPENPLCEGLSMIQKNARQAAQMVQRLAQLVYEHPGSNSYQDLNTVAADAAALLRRVITRRIEVASTLDTAALPAFVDVVDLRQALIALAFRSVQGLATRGRVQLQTSRATAWPGGIPAAGQMPKMPAVCIAVQDDGPLLTDDDAQRLFGRHFLPSYFAHGFALSLYQVRQFVERHHGAVTVESDPAAGNVIRLWLPESDFTEADPSLDHQHSRTLLLAGGGIERQMAAAKALRDHGYGVVVAGDDPAELLSNSDYRFDALLIESAPNDEINMALIAYIRKLHLPIKVILRLSGPQQPSDGKNVPKVDMVLPPGLADETLAERLKHCWWG